MKKVLVAVLVSIGLFLLLAPYWVSRPLYNESLDSSVVKELAIASTQEALTFARFVDDKEQVRVLLVESYREQVLTGVDLTRLYNAAGQDSIELFNGYGYGAIVSDVVGEERVLVNEEQLIMPAEFAATHLAAGTNFADHADEVNAEEPFIFPKLNGATAFNSVVSVGESHLIDHEIEVGLVALNDISKDSAFPQTMGLILSNDITDRWQLIQRIDFDFPMGITGFADGKSREGFMPVGNLLVVPKELTGFLEKIDIALYRNGEKRQASNMGLMIWQPERLVKEIFDRGGWQFNYQGKGQPLLQGENVIPERTVILAGTPAGVIFRELNFWMPWLYVGAGDRLQLFGTYLGKIDIRFE